MAVTVRVDDRQVRAALAEIGRKTPQALARALNDAARAVRTQASKDVRAEYAIKAKDLRGDTIRQERASRSKLEAAVRVSGQRIPLADFGSPRETRQGVAVTVRKRGGRQLYRGAFLAGSIKGTGIEVFWRAKQGDRLVPRGPLKLLLGPSVVQIVAAPRRIRKLLALANESVTKNLKSQIDRFTKPRS